MKIKEESKEIMIARKKSKEAEVNEDGKVKKRRQRGGKARKQGAE